MVTLLCIYEANRLSIFVPASTETNAVHTTWTTKLLVMMHVMDHTSVFWCHMDFSSCISEDVIKTFSKRSCLAVLLLVLIWHLTEDCSLTKHKLLHYFTIFLWISKEKQCKYRDYQTLKNFTVLVSARSFYSLYSVVSWKESKYSISFPHHSELCPQPTTAFVHIKTNFNT